MRARGGVRARPSSRPLALALALASAAAATAAGPSYVSASSPLVLWGGRPSLPLADGAVAFDWQSTAAFLSVSGVGSSITLFANLTGPARVSVYVNGYDAANLMLSNASSSYLLAAAMPDAVNSVEVRYSFEPVYSQADAAAGRTPSFFGFAAGAGGSFLPPTPLARRIDIVGDSISAGGMYDKLQAVNGALSLNDGCHPWSPATGMSDAFNWHHYLCRFFSANCTNTAWSGKGLIHNSGCSQGPLMPQLYTQAFATDAAQPWDFSRAARPDAVIVYLGTNDYSCNLTTDARFTAAAVAFFHNVTAYYAASPPPPSGAPIHFFAAVGLMSPTRPLAAVKAAIAQANADGLRASFLDMTNATADGCGGHPGPIGHWQMALQAAPQIKAAMAW